MTEVRTVAWDSVEGQNLRAATAFLRSMGETDSADKLDRWMRDGWIRVDPKEDDNADTSRLTGTISLGRRKSEAAANGGNLLNADRPEDFAKILSLARTLYHERFHSENDATFGRWGPAMSRDIVKGIYELTAGSLSALFYGGTVFTSERLKVHELEPWTETLFRLNEWMNRYAAASISRTAPENERRAAEERYFAVATELKDALESFIGSDCFGENPKPYGLMLEACEGALALLERKKQARLPAGPPGEQLQKLYVKKDQRAFEELARGHPEAFKAWKEEQEARDKVEREAFGGEEPEERRRQERLLAETISKRNTFIANLSGLR